MVLHPHTVLAGSLRSNASCRSLHVNSSHSADINAPRRAVIWSPHIHNLSKEQAEATAQEWGPTTYVPSSSQPNTMSEPSPAVASASLSLTAPATTHACNARLCAQPWSVSQHTGKPQLALVATPPSRRTCWLDCVRFRKRELAGREEGKQTSGQAVVSSQHQLSRPHGGTNQHTGCHSVLVPWHCQPPSPEFEHYA